MFAVIILEAFESARV